MKTLIIGSKGFIGSHLLNYYKLNSLPVIACDVVTDYEDQDYFQIDATNANYHFLFEKFEISVCINCSGAASVPLSIINPLKDYTLNTVNVFKILDAIREYQPKCKFINLSSAAIYGNPIRLPIQENFGYSPVSPYGIHKMQAELICKEFFDFYNLHTCSLRIFSAYGEGLKKQLFWDLYQKFFKPNEVVELFGTGIETRDFIYIGDIIQAINCILKNANFNGEAINIANGEELTIKSIAELFNKEFGLGKKIVFNNIQKKGDPLNWRADISTLKSYGYKQKISIEQGTKKFINWAKG